MRTIFMFWLSCFLAFPAVAETPTQRAEREAHQYLAPCNFENDSRQSLCRSNQYWFVYAYVHAMGGDIPSMGGVASDFMPASRCFPDDVISHVGDPVSLVQSCAWEMVQYQRENTGMYESLLRARCSKLDQADKEQAKVRAMQILTLLQTAPASPGEDWGPTMPGPPRVAASRKAPLPLITEVPAEDPPMSPPPPPKGCPGNP